MSTYLVQLVSAQTHRVLPCAAPWNDGTPLERAGLDCELSITTNYRQVFGDLVEKLNGRNALEAMAPLMGFCLQHRWEKPDGNYFKPTLGNAVHALNRLVLFAKEHPGGVWRVT